MKIKFAILLFMNFFILSAGNLFAQSEQEQRIRAAYMLAFGRDATGNANSGEVQYWLGQGKLSIADIMARHQQHFKTDVNAHKNVIDRAYQDALGRNAEPGEIAHWTKGYDTYTSLMNNHIQWLRGNPAEYEKVIRRAYKYVFGSNYNIKKDEIAYWNGQGVHSYLMLVGYHQDYKRRSQSGGSANIRLSPAVASVSISSPTVLAETFKASGVLPTGGGSMVAAGAGNMVAAGAGNMVAAGAGNIIAR